MIQLELYIKEITRFLRTVTLKNEYFADQMFKVWVREGFKDKLPDYLHPYYRHLNGDYILRDLNTFRSETGITPDQMSDEEICDKYGLSTTVTIGNKTYKNREVYTTFDDLVMINSIDTKERVPLTKKLLSDRTHQKTSTLYKIPNKYYYNVCATYPQSTDIIKAIVYPIPSIAKAIQAKHLDVLSCDLDQLTEAEADSLYGCMIDTLHVLKHRWSVAEFTQEELYAAAIQAKIWNILTLALFKQRIVNIRTAAAHPYHVWEYLKSHGLDDYSSVLSTEQAMFLYRNFGFLLRNRGSEQNLILLVHKLLSDWNITIHSKNLLQQYTDPSKCELSTIVDSTIVNKSVLDKLAEIDKNKNNYLCRTALYKDELDAFDLLKNDLQELKIGEPESLSELFSKEQHVGYEYQQQHLFDNSTSEQRKMFSRTPHSYLPTKFLEINRVGAVNLMNQIYARSITENLLYRISMGEGDYYLSFIPDGVSYPVNLTIKETIAAIIYCYYKELNMYTEGMMPPTHALLTIPYNKDIPEVPEEFMWDNISRPSLSVYNILPTQLMVEFPSISGDNKSIYSLKNKEDAVEYWIWENPDGMTITYDYANQEGGWLLNTGNDTMWTERLTPYDGWMYWEPVWTYQGSTEIPSKITVHDYEYRLNYAIPEFKHDTLDEFTQGLHNQALSYITLYRELHGSDWSRQHAALGQYLDKATYSGYVELDLLGGASFEEFIYNTSGLSEICSSIDNEDPTDQQLDYAKLGNTIIRALFNIDTDFITDNAGVTSNRFKKLKELFVSMCSYNVAFLEGDIASTEYAMTTPSMITQDIIKMELGCVSSSYVDHVDHNSSIGLYMTDIFEPFNINSSIIEVMNTPIPIAEDTIINGYYVDQDGTTVLVPSGSTSPGDKIPWEGPTNLRVDTHLLRTDGEYDVLHKHIGVND